MIILNKKEIIIENFPNGESLIKTKDLIIDNFDNEIIFKFKNDSEITHLIFLKSYLDELMLPCKLLIPYLPYSRMDRTEGITLFTLKYFCKIINNLNFKEVTILEPHSDVSVALLDRVKVINKTMDITKGLLNRIDNKNDLYIVYPDAGAAKRYSKDLEFNNILTANKTRDFKTGFITSLEINGSVKSKDFKAIIVDDLCSKGGTFKLTAEKLKEIGAREISLVVTHCEDTIKDGDLLKSDLIDKIYTTNSILTIKDKKLNIENLFV